MKRNFLQAEWKNLILANYIVDPALLLPYLPKKTFLDQYNGKVFISLVGFLFANTKMLGLTIPFHINFEEVNLRFYVINDTAGTIKRGVVFIKEIVPRPAITFIANKLYHENYCTMPMKHNFSESAESRQFNYEWKFKNKWYTLEATTEKNAAAMEEGSEMQFIAEHYWGYSKFNAATSFEYEVQHPTWKVYPLKSYFIDCNFRRLYGDRFSLLDDAIPHSVFVAEGSQIAVLHKRNL